MPTRRTSVGFLVVKLHKQDSWSEIKTFCCYRGEVVDGKAHPAAGSPEWWVTGAARQNDPAASAVEPVEHCSPVRCAPAGPLEPEPPPTAPPTPPTGTAPHTQTLKRDCTEGKIFSQEQFLSIHGWNLLWCSCAVLPVVALFLAPHTWSYSRSSLCRECSSCLLSANCCWSKLTSCCRLNTHQSYTLSLMRTLEFPIETTFFTWSCSSYGFSDLLLCSWLFCLSCRSCWICWLCSQLCVCSLLNSSFHCSASNSACCSRTRPESNASLSCSASSLLSASYKYQIIGSITDSKLSYRQWFLKSQHQQDGFI